MKRASFSIPLLIALCANALAASPPWSTTFDCTDWTDPNPWTSCDNLYLGNDTSSQCGQYSSRNDTANNPLGSGKGFRMWHSDAPNGHTARPYIDMTHSSNQIWIRIYHRWQKGTVYNGGWIKMLYINELGPTPNILLELTTRSMRFLNPGRAIGTIPYGWHNLFPSGASDGSWHCFEYYFNRTTGTWSMWVDGALRGTVTRISIPPISGLISWRVNNQGFDNGTCMWEDMDDIAISTTGYIGPLGGTPVEPSRR